MVPGHHWLTMGTLGIRRCLFFFPWSVPWSVCEPHKHFLELDIGKNSLMHQEFPSQLKSMDTFHSTQMMDKNGSK